MNDEFRDYYEVLNVRFNAPRDEIRRAFYKAALYWHPDRDRNRHNQAAANEMMSLVNEAWEVLENPLSRKEYDRERMAWHNAKRRNATYEERFRSERQEYSQPHGRWEGYSQPQDSRESEASPFEEIRQTPIWVQILIWLLAIALIGGILAGIVWGVIEIVKLVVALVEFIVDLVVGFVEFIVDLVVGFVKFVVDLVVGIVKFIVSLVVGFVEFIVDLVVGFVKFVVDLVVGIVKFIVSLVVGIALVLGLLWLGWQMSNDERY